MKQASPVGPLVTQALVAVAAAAIYLLFPELSQVPPPEPSISGKLAERPREQRKTAPAPAPAAEQSAAPEEPKAPGACARGAIAARSWTVPEHETDLTAFRDWAVRYLEAPEPARPALEQEGREAARQRLQAFAKLIETDPRLAIVSTIPYAVRKELPASVTELLERRVSAVGSLSVFHTTPPGDQPALRPAVQRLAQARGELYEAYTFGEAPGRAGDQETELNGVAVFLNQIEPLAGAQAEPGLAALAFGKPAGKIALSPYPARLIEHEEALDYLAEAPPEVTSLVSKRALDGSGEEVYVVELGGQRSLFTSRQAALTMAGLPPEGWDIMEYSALDQASFEKLPGLPIVAAAAAGHPDPDFAKGQNRRCLLIRLVFPDHETTVPDGVLASSYNEYRDALRAASYGQNIPATLSSNVDDNGSWLLPPVMMPNTKRAYEAGAGDLSRDTFNAVRELLASAGHSFVEYRHFVMITVGALIAGGQGSYGPWHPPRDTYLPPEGMKMGWAWCGMSATDTDWNTFVLMHECGHNLFLSHAHAWANDASSVAGPGCTEEHGDGQDAMGGGNWRRSYMGSSRVWLEWIPQTDAPLVTQSRTYRLASFDANAGPATRVLRVPHPAIGSHAYWLEHRNGINGAAPSDDLRNSVMLRWGPVSGRETWRLDTTPAGLGNGLLFIGHTFHDRKAGVCITPVARAGNAVHPAVAVVVTVHPAVGNRPPGVGLSASTLDANLGEQVTFSASASDPDGDELAYGWDLRGIGQSWDNAPVQTISWSVPGEYPVQLRVSDMKGGETRQTLIVRAGNPVNVHRIAGRVVDERGAPIAGVRVSAGGGFAFSDSDGTYTLAGLAPGTYNVTARDPVAEDSTMVALGLETVTVSSSDISGIDFVARAIRTAQSSAPEK